ncbi:MAG: geranylgeranyl reductase family protein [Chitinophagales bacterium]|nr:geranylgeranyl reductase family protein [Chitinophagales bacterium]
MSYLSADILILGAGPAGITTAMFLAKAGIQPLVVDKAVFPRDKVCGDALSGKVVDVLKKLDERILHQLELEPMQVGSYGVTFIAPNLKTLRVPFRAKNEQSKTAPGFIAKRIDFDDFLVRFAKEQYNIEVKEETELTEFEYRDNHWHCSDKKKSLTIKAKLVLVADGAQSVFARHVAGIEVEPEHYCAGIRAYYTGVKNMDKENFIELFFLDELLPGYLWIFPLPNNQANVGLGVRSDKISKRKMNLKELLPAVINQYPQLKERFADAKLEGTIKGFGLPLGSKKRKISGDGYLLTGDAASLIDPFTGEGIGNAMFSGMFAAQQAVACLKQNDFSVKFITDYDKKVYTRLWRELSLSRRMQQMVTVPWLFNFIVNKATSNKALQETISCMFTDLDLRKKLRQPKFYFDLLFR